MASYGRRRWRWIGDAGRRFAAPTLRFEGGKKRCFVRVKKVIFRVNFSKRPNGLSFVYLLKTTVVIGLNSGEERGTQTIPTHTDSPLVAKHAQAVLTFTK